MLVKKKLYQWTEDCLVRNFRLTQVGEDGDEWQDWLVDKDLDHDLKFAHQEEMEQENFKNFYKYF